MEREEGTEHVDELLRQATAHSNKSRIVRMALVATLIAVIAAVVLVVIPNVQNDRTYQRAAALEQQGDYAAAHSIYKDLGSYKDSAQKSRETLELAHRKAYEEAEALEAAGDFDAAEKAFRKLGNYKGARGHVKNMDNMRLEAAYQEAEELEAAGEIEAARLAFADLAGYKDASERAEALIDSTQGEYYAKGLEAEANGDFEEAFAQFSRARNYKDAALHALPYAHVGDVVRMGTSAKGATMTWTVIDEKDGALLILADNVFEYCAYDNAEKTVLWSECSLHDYLAGDFAKKRFSDAERALFMPVQTNSEQTELASKDNTKADKLFLLSQTEANETYVGTFVPSIGTDWWLRTTDAAAESPAIVHIESGQLYRGWGKSKQKNIGIRPAVWIDLTAISFE